MQAIMESLFDVCYLLFAVLTGVMLMRKSQGRKLIHLFGVMSVALGCGDAFHLVPRVLNYWLAGDFTAWLGIGTLVTSITMTVFYLLLEYARRERYAITGEKGVLCAIWALSLVRIVLCLFPQNQWTQADAPWIWGIYRNIPFAVLGVMTVALWLRSAKEDQQLKWLWLAVLLSFGFYFPVVLWADTLPIIGMMMLPKTCMYIWMLCMFGRVERATRE